MRTNLYTDRSALFAALSITKADDVPHIKRMFDGRSILTVGDLCGGYGRLRLHISSQAFDWTVIDRSSSMISLGRRLMRQHGIFRTKFKTYDICDTSFLDDIGCFDALLLAFNSINELTDLQRLFRNAQVMTRPGSLLFVKSIFLPKDFPIENRTLYSSFLSLKGELWDAVYLSKRFGVHPEKQTVDITFTRFGDMRTRKYLLERTLWTLSEMDRAAEDNRFKVQSRVIEEGITIYRREN